MCISIFDKTFLTKKKDFVVGFSKNLETKLKKRNKGKVRL